MAHDDGGYRSSTDIRRKRRECEPPANEQIAKTILMAVCAIDGKNAPGPDFIRTELRFNKEKYQVSEADISDAAINFVLECNRLFKLCPGE